MLDNPTPNPGDGAPAAPDAIPDAAAPGAEAAGGWQAPPPPPAPWPSTAPAPWLGTPQANWATAAPTSGVNHAAIELITAIVLLVSVFLPWVTLSFSSYGYSISWSLWELMDSDDIPLWPYLVIFGGVIAVIAAGIEAARHPAGRVARGWTLGGFLAALCGVGFAFASGARAFGLYEFDDTTVTYGFGYWLCLLAAAVGTVVIVVHFRMPPNPARMYGPMPAYGAPAWGPPPGVMPAQYAPPPAFAPQPAYPPQPAPAFGPPPAWGPPPPPAWGPPPPPAWGPPPPPAAWGPPPPPPAAWGPPPPPPAAWGPSSAESIDLATHPGYVNVVEAGNSSTVEIKPGERFVVGRGEKAQIRVSDAGVAELQASVERSGNGWIVCDLDPANPTRLVDPSGASQPVVGELRIPSGQLLVGAALLTLFPVHV